jgi:hypothetical protein
VTPVAPSAYPREDDLCVDGLKPAGTTRRIGMTEKKIQPKSPAASEPAAGSRKAERTTARKTASRKLARKTASRKLARKTASRKLARKTASRKLARKTASRKLARKI